MRKILAFALLVTVCSLVGCHETPAEKVERSVRNAVDDVKDELKK